MSNKAFNTRIRNKRDTAANWEKVASTFQPLDGETIIVDTAAGATRFKVGKYDSTKGRLLYYNELPFTDEALYNYMGNTYAPITALQSMLPKVTTITLGTVWNGSASPYYQDVALSCCTETSIVDLQPSPAQLAEWQDNGWAFTTQSGNGTFRVYVSGGIPSGDAITIQIKCQEVVVV